MHRQGVAGREARAATLEGRKVLPGPQLSSRESYEDSLDFGRDLLARGLRPPPAEWIGPRR